MNRWGCYLLLFLIFAAVYSAFKYLPFWGLVGLAVVFVLSVKFFGRWFVRRFVNRLFLLPFKAKGAVLQNAEVQVHSLVPAVAPPQQPALESNLEVEDELEAEEVDAAVASGPRDYYRLEATVTPGPAAGPFHFWEPGELTLGLPEKAWDDEDDTCEVASVEVEQDGQYQPNEGMKYGGSQRLRFLIGVRPGTEKLVFRYYLEKFGEVQIYQREIGPS